MQFQKAPVLIIEWCLNREAVFIVIIIAAEMAIVIVVVSISSNSSSRNNSINSNSATIIYPLSSKPVLLIRLYRCSS